jgi:hypothetical protein
MLEGNEAEGKASGRRWPKISTGDKSLALVRRTFGDSREEIL